MIPPPGERPEDTPGTQITRKLEPGEGSLRSAMKEARAEPGDPSLEDARLFAAAQARLFGVPPATVEIGRFTVLERLGAGAMGEVYAAYDDRLDRKVALKLMLPGVGDSAGQAHERMLREGQTLARLSHPNVVQVFEVGVFEGRVFICMEFVRGCSLGDWAKDGPRPWQEVLEHYRQAGRGLAAAHDAGLIHRDFKPDNVLVGDDGRVRVADFGLARAQETAQGSTLEGRVRDVLASTTGVSATTAEEPARLTRTGAVLGTPAYMAPEQFLGRGVGAHSDQFGFCVALYEGLFGQRPFLGKHPHLLAANVLAGECQPPPRDSGVPAWIWPILRRGLATDPSDRYERMTDLLVALEQDPARRRRRLLGAGALLGVGLGVGSSVAMLAPEHADPCEAPASLLEGAWDDQQRQRLAEAFAATGLSYAEDTRVRVVDSLDAYARAWLGAHRRACEATHVEHTQSETMLDLRMGCLLGRRERMTAMTDLLARAEPQDVARAVTAVAELPGLEPCSDLELLRQAVQPPENPEIVAAAAELRSRLAPLHALVATGHYQSALPRAREAVDASAELGYAPVEAEARFVLGTLSTELGHTEEAEAELLRAVDLAEGSRHDEQAAEAWIELTRLGLEVLSEPARSSRWLARARAAVTRLGDQGPRHGRVLAHRASLMVLQGRPAEAIDVFLRALEQLGEDSEAAVTRPRVLESLANAQQAASRFDDAADTYRRAQESLEQALGSEHPDVGDLAHDHGTFLVDQGRLEPARAQLDLALSIWRQAYGEDHYKIGMAHLALAKLDMMEGDLDTAQHHAWRARDLYALHLDEDHPDRAAPDINLGVILFFQRDYAGALDAYQRALAGLRRALPAGHLDIGIVLGNLGEAQLALDQPLDAMRSFDEAKRILDALPEPDPQALSLVLKGQGQALLHTEQPRAAVGPLTQALRLRQQAAADPFEMADLRWSLAQALAQADGADHRARAQAQQAVDTYATLGEAGRTLREPIEQWLDEHPDPTVSD